MHDGQRVHLLQDAQQRYDDLRRHAVHVTARCVRACLAVYVAGHGILAPGSILIDQVYQTLTADWCFWLAGLGFRGLGLTPRSSTPQTHAAVAHLNTDVVLVQAPAVLHHGLEQVTPLTVLHDQVDVGRIRESAV